MKRDGLKIPSCPYCCALPKGSGGLAAFKGTYTRVSCDKPIIRFQCNRCDRTFSESTLTREYRQRKRNINHPIYELLVSNVSMRRTAKILNVSRRTVERRLKYLALVAEDEHQKLLKSLPQVTEVQFDDMESSIHTKLKPVSIPLVVDHPSRLILTFDVVSMPAKGKLAKASVDKYGFRPDHRKQGWDSTLLTLKSVADLHVKITSDSHPMYPGQIKKHFPQGTHCQVVSRKACVVGQGELKRGGHDPIFSLNHTAAMFRANVNRLARRTWCTSKKIENLKLHMMIYRLWHNETILAERNKRKRFSPFVDLC